MGMNGTPRDYTVQAIVAAVVIVAIVAGTMVGLSLARHEDVLVLIGILGTIAVTPVIAALIPLIRGVNRTAKANEATAQGVANLQHRMNGGLTEDIRRVVHEAVRSLHTENREIRENIEKIDRRLKDGDDKFDRMEERQDENRRLIEEIQQQIAQTPLCAVPAEGEGS